MVQVYKKVGVTTDGYRGERAILKERVIQGLEKSSFQDSSLQLTVNSPQTIYLTNENFGEGYFILLPDATTLWANWQVTVINESNYSCKIYYYTSNLSQLNLFKEVSGKNMTTCILLDNNLNTDSAGTWTTLRTVETTNADELYKYTTDVLETIDITWNDLQQDETTIVTSLGNLLAGTSVKSIYLKVIETFETDLEHPLTLKVSIGKGSTPAQGETYDYSTDTEYVSNHFITNYDLTTAVANNNFTKDLFNEILSTTDDKQILATFTGTNLKYLTAGSLQIVVEKPKLINPTVLNNPIIQTQLPIGVILPYAFEVDYNCPAGFWPLNGKPLPNARTAVPQFVQKLETINNSLSGEKLIVTKKQWTDIVNAYGSCGKFAWDGNSLIFPRIANFIQGLTDMSQLGKLTEAGLPDITCRMYSEQGLTSNCMGSGDISRPEDVFWSASAWNSLFGKSNTVQPESIKYPYIISIYNKIQNSAELDLQEIIEDSVNKANISLDNLSDIGKAAIVNSCTPDYEHMISGGVGAGNAIPANTWIQVLKTSFVEVDGTDPYTIDVRAWVSPDNGTTKYQVGYFVSDINSNTRGTSFTFIVPAGWYFTTDFENGFSYYIYPFKGVN